MIVKLRSELPADTLVGEIALIETGPDEGVGDCGVECPPPQPDPPMTKANTRDTPVILNIELLRSLVVA